MIRIGDPQRSAKQIAAADSEFAADSVVHGSGPAFPAFADDDAVEVAGPIIYGKDAVAANHAGDPPPEKAILDWAPVESGASITGDLGYSVGNATLTSPPDVSYMKYVTVWERRPDGRWKWIADMGNGRPAPAP